MAKDPWKDKLSKEQYDILRLKHTEAPFSGKLLHNDKDGNYVCAACGAVLFDSSTKFDSGSGWPSFNSPINRQAVTLTEDNSMGMHRTEVTCSNCGSHLGHVFHDAPDQPTGDRFCINSVSLGFKEEPTKAKS
jgi:peptide-methionine (R)-S-oxide reductase